MRGRRVMVVDDESEILETTAVLLRALGHRVQTAATGAEALERIRNDAPEVVFLDVGLPDMDGLDLAKVPGTSRTRRIPSAMARSSNSGA